MSAPRRRRKRAHSGWRSRCWMGARAPRSPQVRAPPAAQGVGGRRRSCRLAAARPSGSPTSGEPPRRPSAAYRISHIFIVPTSAISSAPAPDPILSPSALVWLAAHVLGSARPSSSCPLVPWLGPRRVRPSPLFPRPRFSSGLDSRPRRGPRPSGPRPPPLVSLAWPSGAVLGALDPCASLVGVCARMPVGVRVGAHCGVPCRPLARMRGRRSRRSGPPCSGRRDRPRSGARSVRAQGLSGLGSGVSSPSDGVSRAARLACATWCPGGSDSRAARTRPAVDRLPARARAARAKRKGSQGCASGSGKGRRGDVRA